MITVPEKSDEREPATWQEGFLQMLPRIKQQANFALRDLDAEAKEDALSEVMANAMCAYRRLHERGELQRAFASALVRYAVRQYHAGRKVGGSQTTRDIFSPQARKIGGYKIFSLAEPPRVKEQPGGWQECLIDNHQTRVPDQVAFRIDFPRWLDSKTPRDKCIAEKLALAFSTADVAREFRISPARVSQLRRELADSWYAFIGSRTIGSRSASQSAVVTPTE